MKIYLTVFFMLLNFKLQATEIYLLNTQIGSTLFKDLLVIDQNQGSLTVPGQFTTKVKNYSASGTEMRFDIETLENGEPLKASYKLNPKTLNGFLFIGNEQFPITGEKIYDK